MFNAQDGNGNGKPSSLHHLAEIVAVLRPPPPDYLRRTETSSEYFDVSGNWRGAVEIPEISLEGSEARLGGENKALFLDFVRKMLHWVPERRGTARQLLEHSWLYR